MKADMLFARCSATASSLEFLVDWIQFFTRNRVPFAEHGPNVSRGQVVIRCPWCGASDQGMHLSVNLAGKGFRCFRNANKHSGRNPAKLVMALLNCSWERACELTGTKISLPDNFMSQIKLRLGDK